MLFFLLICKENHLSVFVQFIFQRHLKARDAKKKNKGKTPEEKAIKEFSGLKG